MATANAEWPKVAQWAANCLADAPNTEILGPGVNYCGSGDCVSGTSDPVGYLQGFFTEHPEVNSYHVHMYTGEPSLKITL